jgi:hypothetical protein
MTALSIQSPFPTITDIDGQPLEDGYIWIGVANLPPIGNPIAVYWDAALTQPAALPVRTRGGYPVNAGTPARLYVGSDYSIQVQNRNGSVVYSAPQATERYGALIISSADVSFLQAGSGAVVRTAQSKMRDVVSVKDFGVIEDGSDQALNFNAAADYAASINAPLDLEGLTITYGGGFNCTTAGAQVIWRNGGFKLTAGAKASAAFFIDGVDSVDVENVELDGNRLNVSGNNAGFFVVRNCRLAKFDGIVIRDLRRYGINITPNVETVDIKNVRGYDIGVTGIGADGLGEAIKVENSTNVTIENFTCTNPSGTGGGQVAKVFHCENVTLSNFDITDPDPAKIYPGISMVRNENLTYRNIRIAGSTQVALEDNANINISYDNIVTAGTDKALIMGTDGAGLGDRRSQNTVITNWIDTSTVALAFNIIGALNITLKNVSTPQTLNISRDSPATDRRTENLEMDTVSCGILNTLLVNGRKTYSNMTITGLWTNTGAGVTDFINSSYGSYSNSAQTNVFLARWRYEDAQINISGTMTASGGTFLYRAPTTITNEPFAGEVLANTIFAGSPANQWSQINWTFYDWGTPTVLKTVLQSGSVPRSNVALAVSRGLRTLTFTNSETSDIRIDAVVQLINRNSATVS